MIFIKIGKAILALLFMCLAFGVVLGGLFLAPYIAAFLLASGVIIILMLIVVGVFSYFLDSDDHHPNEGGYGYNPKKSKNTRDI